MIKVESLFPTPVMFNSLTRNFKNNELNIFKNLSLKENLLNARSTNSYVLNLPELTEIKKFIEETLKIYFKEMYQPATDIDIYITQSWINVTKIGEKHHMHNHPNSFISGTFYICADRDIDKIAFSKTDFSPVRITPTSYNTFNSPAWFYDVGERDLILFPSTVFHYVDTVQESPNRKERISLSFNTFLKGNLGDDATLSELKL